MVGYRFKPDIGLEIKELTQSEIDALDDVIEQFGDFNTEQIVEKMHNEDAYKYTGSNCIIPFTFAENLSID
jgi:hypothetical protein